MMEITAAPAAARAGNAVMLISAAFKTTSEWLANSRAGSFVFVEDTKKCN